MTGPFVSSCCAVLEGKAHLAQPRYFNEEEHGNLRGKMPNPKFDRKFVAEVVLTLNCEDGKP